MRENVAYKLQHGKAKEAVDMLEKLHKYVKSYLLFAEVWERNRPRASSHSPGERSEFFIVFTQEISAWLVSWDFRRWLFVSEISAQLSQWIKVGFFFSVPDAWENFSPGINQRDR